MACSGFRESQEDSRAGARKPAAAAPASGSGSTALAAPADLPRIVVEVPDSRIALAQGEGTVVLSHAIPYRHVNPCDFSGEGPELDSVMDFRVELEVLPGGLISAIRAREAGSPVAERFVSADSVVTEPGFVEEFQVGDRKGFRIRLGAEGCGETVSYLPSGSWTLRMARRKVAELDPAASPDAEKIADLPGIIPPGEADGFADRILASAKLVPAGEQAGR